MPMTKVEKGEIVQRLCSAHKKTRDMLKRESISRDYHPGTDIAQRWPLITAAYSGLEQTLKFLIADEKSYTIEELLNHQSHSSKGKNQSNGGRYPYRTHDLVGLYCRLEESKKDVVREYYGQFQSLHSYITIESLGDFLKEVSSQDGRGYERWRYTLIEVEEPLPRNSIEALVAIWGVCTEIARKCVSDKQRVRMLDEKLTQKICQQLQEQTNEVSVRRQDAGEPFQSLAIEVRGRLFQGKHALNVFAEILWHSGQYGSHGLTSVSDQLSETICQWVGDVISYKSQLGMTSLRWFIERAQGRTSKGESIRWNPETKRFEDVPWSLECLSQDELPQNAIAVDNPPSEGTLQKLKMATKESGYKIRENRSFLSFDNSDTNVWYRTLEVSEGHNMKPIVTIWQNQEDDCWRFHFVEECRTDEMNQPIKIWTKLNRILEQFGEFEEVE